MKTRVGFSICGHGHHLFQSYRLNRYSMLGRDEMIYRQLESHKIDEMLIISPSIAPIFQDHESYDLERLLNIYVGVPVGVAGQTGLSQLCHLAELGCIERFCFSGKLHHDRSPELQFVMRNCGRQAIVGLIPFLVDANLSVSTLSPNHLEFTPLTLEHVTKAYDLCDEVIFQDIMAYGSRDCFHIDQISPFVLWPNRTILNGGIGADQAQSFMNLGVAALYLDNLAFHSERNC